MMTKTLENLTQFIVITLVSLAYLQCLTQFSSII